MENSAQLAQRFREVILNGKWIANTNYREQLMDMDWQDAGYKVLSFNTPEAIAFHIRYYISGILKVFEGGELEIRDRFSFDFEPCRSQEEWEVMLSGFWKDTEKFAGHVERMSSEKLDSLFVDERYGTYRRNIEAMIEHAYYHLGQLVLIKKAIAGRQDNGL